MATDTRDLELGEEDDDLLPEPRRIRDEASDTDAQAVSRIEAATGATSEGTKEAKPARKAPLQIRRPKLPPLPRNLDEAVMTFPVKLKLVSLGKSIANVNASLTFDVPIPQDFREVLGEHAYTVGFLGGFLGEGVRIVDTPLKTDAENRLVQTMKVHIPRFLNEQTDQLLLSIAPLVGGRKYVESLFALEWPWRLNIPVDIEGELDIFAMQQAFDLTAKSGGDTGTTYTPEP